MLIVCELCDKEITGETFHGIEHKCQEEDIREHIQYLKKQARNFESLNYAIRDNIFHLLKDIKQEQIKDNQITISWDYLEKIWDAAKCRFHDANTAKSFLSDWLVTHMILCEAADLFDSKYNHESVKFKLEKLRKAIVEAETRLYPTSLERINLSVDDIIEQIRETPHQGG
jgi:hypothetical protein